MNLRLIDKHIEAGDVTTFVFEPEQALTWQAGQYLHYTLHHDNEDDRGHERWFTIAAAPYEERVKMTTRMVRERRSSFKAALARLPLGATIEADSPEGDFVIDDPARHYVFIVGGVGITPVRAILLQLDHDGLDIGAHVLYAHRGDVVPPFVQELDSLARRHAGLTVQYIADPRHIETSDIEAAALRLDDPYYYVSGPEPMVEHYAKLLADIGIPGDRVKTDDFPGYTGI